MPFSQKICVGTGVLALPYSFAQGGVLFSAVGLYIISKWNIYSVERLLRCEEIVQRLPGVDSERNISTFSLVALKALGEFGTSLVDYTIGEMEGKGGAHCNLAISPVPPPCAPTHIHMMYSYPKA